METNKIVEFSPKRDPVVQTLAEGGGPPHDESMEIRVAKLEAIIPTLATKADVSDLRGEMHKGFGDLRVDFERGQKESRAWMLATVLALFVGIITLGNFIANGLEKRVSSPNSQTAGMVQPIIIQVPAQMQAQAPSPTSTFKPLN